MKPALFSAAFLALFAAAATGQARPLALPGLAPATATPTDTIVVRLPNKAVMTLVVRNAAQLRELKSYQLDSLTSRLATYIAQAETAAKAGTANQVTMRFYPDQDQPGKNLPAEVRITAHKPGAGTPEGTTRTQVFLNKTFGITREKDEDGSSSYHINRDNKQSASDSLRRERRRNGASVKFEYGLGFNTFVNGSSGGNAGVPSLDVVSWRSLYSNFGLDYVQPLHISKRSKLALTLGPEISLNNFRTQNNSQWAQSGDQTFATQMPSARQIEYSTLSLTTLNLPVMLRLKLYSKASKRTLSAGIGGFGGYRLGSDITTQYRLAGDNYKYEDKTSGQLNLNNWQYGLQGELGFHGLRFFAKYNLNELFREGQGPQTHLLSFGLRLTGF